MSQQSYRNFFNSLAEQIFEKEKELPEGDPIRTELYHLRCSVNLRRSHIEAIQHGIEERRLEEGGEDGE